MKKKGEKNRVFTHPTLDIAFQFTGHEKKKIDKIDSKQQRETLFTQLYCRYLNYLMSWCSFNDFVVFEGFRLLSRQFNI